MPVRWARGRTLLYELDLGDNRLTGTLPDDALSGRTLRRLALRLNALTGTVPSFQAGPNLRVLDLGQNALSGDPFTEVTRAPLLEQLYLDDNNLEGTLPSVTAEGNGGTGMHLVKFSSLKWFYAQGNRLFGTVPSDHARLRVFTAPMDAYRRWYDVRDNRLDGPAPEWTVSTREILGRRERAPEREHVRVSHLERIPVRGPEPGVLGLRDDAPPAPGQMTRGNGTRLLPEPGPHERRDGRFGSHHVANVGRFRRLHHLILRHRRALRVARVRGDEDGARETRGAREEKVERVSVGRRVRFRRRRRRRRSRVEENEPRIRPQGVTRRRAFRRRRGSDDGVRAFARASSREDIRTLVKSAIVKRLDAFVFIPVTRSEFVLGRLLLGRLLLGRLVLLDVVVLLDGGVVGHAHVLP